MVENKTARKIRFFFQSIAAFFYAYIIFFMLDFSIGIGIFLIVIFVILGSIISHYPNVKLHNILYGTILPLSLFLGTFLFLEYFPNLSFVFKMLVLIGFSFMYYVVSLVDNIFLVVQDREEQIPLYRVAVTWAQILSVTIAIPLFSSLFKININAVWQTLLVCFFSTLICIYQLWGLSFDKDTKNIKAGESITLISLVVFMVFVSSISVSFFPTESFLRALYVGSILMFGLNYVDGHLKNNINKKLLIQSLALSIISFIILLIFTP